MGKKAQTSKVVKTVGGLVLGQYVPGFLKIHLRYIKRNVRVWLALFVAPFLAIKLFFVSLFNIISDGTIGTWKFDLIAIFVVALCFFLAERHRSFRKFYVYFAPAVMCLGLLYWAANGGADLVSPGFIVKAVLIGYLTFRIGRFTIDMAYQILTEGADPNYREGRDLYDQKEYELAMPLLEASAARGHFKSMYLIGEAYERGFHYKKDRIKAAEYYWESGKKGYAKGSERFRDLMDRMSKSEKVEMDKNFT